MSADSSSATPINATKQDASTKIPIICLKTPSPTPASDIYSTRLSPRFEPHYVPVLNHTLLPDALIKLFLTHLVPRNAGNARGSRPPSDSFPYGALILTSQRAVAALSTALGSPPIQTKIPRLHLESLRLRIYTVGPATARAAHDVAAKYLPACTLHGGADAGNGEILAGIILSDPEAGYNHSKKAYRSFSSNDEDAENVASTSAPTTEDQKTSLNQSENQKKKEKRPILFLVGEKRRDIIPRTLQSPTLDPDCRITVDEMEVYASAELEDFEFNFARTLAFTAEHPASASASVSRETGSAYQKYRWIVVFSPMAGKGMMKGLGWLDPETGKKKRHIEAEGKRRQLQNDTEGEDESEKKDEPIRTLIACIGPTTQAYLRNECGIEADVVAKEPSPSGLIKGIEMFMREMR